MWRVSARKIGEQRRFPPALRWYDMDNGVLQPQWARGRFLLATLLLLYRLCGNQGQSQ